MKAASIGLILVTFGALFFITNGCAPNSAPNSPPSEVGVEALSGKTVRLGNYFCTIT